MRVVITGMTGFIGSHLAAALRARGHQVSGDKTRVGQQVDGSLYEGADGLVHCAHDFRRGSEDVNVEGARLFFDAARECHRIFVSSHSARADALSEYGLSKYRIEQFWLEGGGAVVRPGLVIGPGGLFARNLRAIRGAKVIPLVDGGRDAVAVIAIADLCGAMVKMTEERRGGAHNLFNQTLPRMRDIVDTVLRLAGRRTPVVSVPFGVAMATARTGERLGLKLPFTSASLAAMKLNRRPVHESDLSDFLKSEMSLDAAIEYSDGRDCRQL